MVIVHKQSFDALESPYCSVPKGGLPCFDSASNLYSLCPEQPTIETVCWCAALVDIEDKVLEPEHASVQAAITVCGAEPEVQQGVVHLDRCNDR